MRKYIIPLIIVAIFLTPLAQAVEYTVGVSPPVVDMGLMEKDSSNLVKFYIVTVSPDPLTVRLDPDRGTLDFFNRGAYRDVVFNYSEENTKTWAEIFVNPVELLPTDPAVGYGIRGSREVNFLLNVPKNAEPGYHLLIIKPYPLTQQEDMGRAGANIVAITPVSILFRVNGYAERSGRIVDVTYNGGNLETYFKNTGTVSITARASNKIAGQEALSSTDIVKPGELHKFMAPISLKAGDYGVATRVEYTTGSATFDSTLTVTQTVAAVAENQEAGFPIWIVIIIILIIVFSIVLYMWRR
jgi:hypothetical protein